MPNDYNQSTVTIFGVKRKIEDWISDPLCRVPRWLFIARLNQGMNAEAALSRPTSAHRTAHTILRGIYWHKGNKKWLARIKVDGKLREIGYYDSELEAGMAYDAAAKRFHGADAVLNFG